MWAEACELLDQAERRHRRFFDLLSGPSAQTRWEPPVDVLVAGTELEVVLALPGAHADDVSVTLTPTGVQIDARVPPPTFAPNVTVLRLEIPYGRMQRRIDLPPGRYVLVERRLDRGYLFLRLTGVTP